jgi:hypothetical protein
MLVPRESLIDNEMLGLLLSTQGRMPSRTELKQVARVLLQTHHLKCPIRRLKENAKYILTGTRIPVLPTLLNGKLGSRQGKDMAYNQFWTLVNEAIPRYEERCYVGLPANQIATLPLYIGGKITACEKNSEVVEWQKQVANLLCPEVEVCKGNIFKCIPTSPKNWNVFDFDLMSRASLGLCESIGNAIDKGAVTGSVVINVATCIGRNISWKQYREIMPFGLQDTLIDYGFEVKKTISGHYRDRQVPVAWEQIIIHR